MNEASPDRVLPTGPRTELAGRADAVLERLHTLYPSLIDLSLGRLEALLGKLGHPERHLPPVIHVAGTNGKGSVCANLRGIAEAASLRTHVTISPHLVDITERFRIAGRLVSDTALTATLEEIERVNGGAEITVFEVLTACALLLFARTPADLAIVEVGLGGRHDATNVIPAPAACAITAISMDHQAFLGDTLEQIAAEKAGIMKPGVPVVTGRQTSAAFNVLVGEASRAGARLLARDRDWTIVREPVSLGNGGLTDGLRYEDARGVLLLPLPGLLGPHQVENAGIAVAALRAAALPLAEAAFAGIARVSWPGRMQLLTGSLARSLPPGWELWLDGGHNPGAGAVLAETLARWHEIIPGPEGLGAERPVHLVIGMKQSKDADGFLRPLLPHAASLWAVQEPGQHMALPVEAIVAASGGRARPGPTVAEALAALPRSGPPARVLICGSLYLAGEVLKLDGYVPN